MRDFAKLYETKLGQILVKVDDGDEGPEVRVYFTPEDLGVCHIAFTWSDGDEKTKWKKADKTFNNMTQEKAISAVSEVLGKMGIQG